MGSESRQDCRGSGQPHPAIVRRDRSAGTWSHMALRGLLLSLSDLGIPGLSPQIPGLGPGIRLTQPSPHGCALPHGPSERKSEAWDPASLCCLATEVFAHSLNHSPS